MENLSKKALEYLALYGFNVLAALLIFIVGRFVADIVSKIIEKAVVRSSKDITPANFVKHISYVGLLILVFKLFNLSLLLLDNFPEIGV